MALDREWLEQYEDSAYARCKRCDGKLGSLEHDGEHLTCESQVDEARRAESIRRLHLSTARLLHRIGEHEEAAWHEMRAGRGGKHAAA
jgi:hypothetical protein